MRSAQFSRSVVCLVALSVLMSSAGALIASPPLPFEELPFRHYDTDSATLRLPSASVQKVFQDRQGFIWLGFYSTGLARYDGRTLETYSTADGLVDLTVREIAEDAGGYLWVGTDAGMVVSSKPLTALAPGERVGFTSRVGAVTIPVIRTRGGALISDSSGAIWVGTRTGSIDRYSLAGRVLSIETHPVTGAEPRNRPVLALVARRDRSIWGALTNGGIAIVRAGQPGRSFLRPGVELPDETFSSLYEDTTGALWAGATSGSIFRAAPGTTAFKRVATDRPLGERVLAITEIERRIWIASRGSGILVIDAANPSQQRRINVFQGLLSETVWSILHDREGSIWVAQNGGLSLLRSDFEAFGALTGDHRIGHEPLLSDVGTFAAIPPTSNSGAFAGQLWVATGNGVTILREDGESAILSTDQGLRARSVYSLAVDDAGNIWSGTAEGLSVTTADRSHPAASRTVDAALFGRRVWINAVGDVGPIYGIRTFRIPRGRDTVAVTCAAGGPGVMCFGDDEWFSMTDDAGVPLTSTNLELDSRGYLWISTSDSGIFRSTAPLTYELLENASVSSADRSAGRKVRQVIFRSVSGSRITHEKVSGLHAIEDEVWAATTRGITIFDVRNGRVIAEMPSAQHFEGRALAALERAPSGMLWAALNRGLAEIDPKTRQVLRLVQKEDGLVNDEPWGYDPLSAQADGTVYFSTARGVAIYRPSLDRVNSVPPTPQIRSVAFRQNRRGSNEITFEYAPLSYSDQPRVNYRVRLVGYDEWSQPGTEGKIRYTNLTAFLIPRRYTFEVIASNGDGVWSASAARWEFRVLPAWWATWWAFGLYLALLVLIAIAIDHYRSEQLREMNRTLAELVESRTAEMRTQTDELEALDRTVRAINREVSLEGVLQALLEQGLKLFPQAQKGGFLLVDHDRNVCEVAASAGYEAELLEGMTLTTDEALRRYSARAEMLEQGVYLIRQFDGLPGEEKFLNLPRPEAMLVMEVHLARRLEGFLVFDNLTDANAFDRSDLRRLRRFREHATSAIGKARMLHELELKNREVEEASQAKSTFLANMSHELRTPMNAIIGFSEILVERLESQIPSRYHDFLKMVLSSAQHLLGIVNDILDISKIEAGKMEVWPERFTVGPAIEGVCLVMKGFASKRGISFVTDVAEDVPSICTDNPKFKQILYNLLSNAVKFSKQDGTVEIRVRRAQLGAREAIEMAVEDHGIGISTKDQEVIFQAFRQVDASTTRQYGGTGLGLWLVHRFAEILGGNVKVESEPGEGSTFRVTLPIEFAAVAVTPAAEEQPLAIEEDTTLA